MESRGTGRVVLSVTQDEHLGKISPYTIGGQRELEEEEDDEKEEERGRGRGNGGGGGEKEGRERRGGSGKESIANDKQKAKWS